MTDAIAAFRWFHIALGFLVLASFWLPMLSKKGSNVHVWSGRLYSLGMSVVLASAAVLCVMRAFQGKYGQSLLLGFLTLISFNALYQGLVFVRQKEMAGNYKHIAFITNILILISGSVLLIWGLKTMHPLFLIFGALGIATSPAAIKRFRPFNDYKPKYGWMQEHVAAMLISAGAAYTGFFAFGSRQFFVFENTTLAIIPWVLPTLLVLTYVVYYTRRLNKPRR